MNKAHNPIVELSSVSSRRTVPGTVSVLFTQKQKVYYFKMQFRLKRRLLWITLLCCLALLIGCDRQQPPINQVVEGDLLPTYRIGLLPEHNLFDQKKLYDPLLDYLSKQLGVTLQSVILPNYGNIIDNFYQLNLDGAFFGSLTGAMAIKTLQVEPLARPQYRDGTSSYYGMIFVKKSSNIRTAKDMRGKRMVFVDRATTAGYLLPLAYFKEIGIDDYRSWFSEAYFSGTHEDAIYDVLNGLADIGAAKNTVFYQLAKADKRIVEELEILKMSPHVPANSLAMLKDIPEDLKQGLLEELLTMHQNSEGREILKGLGIECFIRTSVEDYQPVLDYAASIGLDLSNYKYSNR
ncbi:MAG: phosphate/phosphite/phosphonate ABC transporter substrate-binding protein [Desulfuromonadaceae bacterium]|nr:phosphate/phosphite/phosphonate ABC transporter substrate-binding protein [Desulfuromonadaceae bacterium]